MPLILPGSGYRRNKTKPDVSNIAGVDWANPLAKRGLRFAMPLSPRPRDLVNNDNWYFYPGIGQAATLARNGLYIPEQDLNYDDQAGDWTRHPAVRQSANTVSALYGPWGAPISKGTWWFRAGIAEDGTTNGPCLLWKEGGGGNGVMFLYRTSPNQLCVVTVSSSVGVEDRLPQDLLAYESLDGNTLYDFCITFDGTTYRLYIDGDLITSIALTGSTALAHTGGPTLGGLNVSAQGENGLTSVASQSEVAHGLDPWSGLIDTAYRFDECLTADEVKTLSSDPYQLIKTYDRSPQVYFAGAGESVIPSGTGSETNTQDTSGTGSKSGSSQGSLTAAQDTSGTGSKTAAATGSESVSAQTIPVGSKSASESISISAAQATVGTGEKLAQAATSTAAAVGEAYTGSKVASGAGAINQSSATAGTGSRVGGTPSFTGTIAATQALVGTGTKTSSSSGSESNSVGEVFTGFKTSSSAGSINHPAATTGTGSVVGGTPSFTGAINQAQVLSGSGEKKSSGAGSESVAYGEALSGLKITDSTGTIAQTSTTVGTGSVASDTPSGSGVISALSGDSGSGIKVSTELAALALSSGEVVSGRKISAGGADLEIADLLTGFGGRPGSISGVPNLLIAGIHQGDILIPGKYLIERQITGVVRQ